MTGNASNENGKPTSSRESSSAPKFARALQVIPRIAGATLAVAGTAVLAGWTFKIEILKTIVPGFVSMKANTALGFVAAGIALLLIAKSKASPARVRTGKAFAGAAGLIGSMTIVEYLSGTSLGIDQAVFEDVGASLTAAPGRMAFSTAATFVLLALALIVADPVEGRRSGLVQWVCLAGCTFPVLALIGYSFGVESFYKVLPTHTAQALHTAVLFLVGLVGTSTIGPPRGFVAEITSRQLGGQLARKFMPVALLLPLLIAWLRLAGEQAGLYSTEYGLAIMVTSMTLLLGALTYFAAAFLNRADSEQELAHTTERDLARRLQAILAHSTSLVFMKDLGGRYVMASRSFENALALTPSELIGHTDAELLSPVAVEALGAGDEFVIALKDSPWKANLNWVPPTPHTRTSWSSFPSSTM